MLGQQMVSYGWWKTRHSLISVMDHYDGITSATIAYYGGQLNGNLLNWLAKQSRAAKVVHFPDYDGVGLANFARLYAILGDNGYSMAPDWPNSS